MTTVRRRVMSSATTVVVVLHLVPPLSFTSSIFRARKGTHSGLAASAHRFAVSQLTTESMH